VLKRDAANNRELAEKENAPKWSPAEFRKGEENFEDGEQAYANYALEKSIDNYQEAKYYFQQASRLAPQRRDQYTNYVRQIENYRKKLAEIDADEFRPKKSQNLDNRVQEARSTYDQGDYLEARELASSLVEDYKAFYRDLYEEVQYARNLKQSIVNGLDKAEEAEAHIWSPEELQQASIMYSRGVSAYRNFELEQSINLFEKAQTLAQKAIQLAPRRKAKYESGSLMEEVRKEIEEASELTIMTEEGEIIAPEDREEEEESGENQEGEQHSFLLDDGSIIVILGDESESDLLTQAKELYRKGVQAREQGDYEEAKEYFSKAGQLVHRYKALAIGDIETVQVRKSNSLWYLAGQQYKSPLYWPFIWVLNMDKVNDPDLIYPGWKLMVPVR
jgi:tetratricopeptide (TPR) repeat protein